MNTKNILVVDDEEMITDIISVTLEESGYAATVTNNPETALEILNKKPFDVLITDLNMPQMEGEELIAKAREMLPGLITIVLTGYGSLESARKVIEAGCDEYLLKPLKDMNLINMAVTRSLQKRKILEQTIVYRKMSNAKSNMLHDISERLSEPAQMLNDAYDALKSSVEEGQMEEVKLLLDSMGDHIQNITEINEQLVKGTEKLRNLEGKKAEPGGL